MNSEKKLTMKTTGFALTAIAAVAILSVTASAQLPMLDDFSGKAYVKTLKATQTGQTDAHYEALPHGSPVGAARYTYFQVEEEGTYAQSSTLDIGNGVCIVDSGFQNDSALEILYGTNLKGDQVPMELNLSSYSGLQLSFAGIVSTEGLDVNIEIWPSSGGYYVAAQGLPTNGNSFTVDFPFTTFSGAGGTLTQTEVENISYIIIVTEGEGDADVTDSFGITSFQAYN